MLSLARRGATRLIPIREVSTFTDGETLELPRRPRVVHAPGHTPVVLPGHGEPWTGGAPEAARLARLAGPS